MQRADSTEAKVMLGIILGVVGILAIGYVALCLTIMQGFSSLVLAIVPSPAMPETEVWLLEDGFIDRGKLTKHIFRMIRRI